MKYKYKWVRVPFQKHLKDKVIPLKANKVLFTEIPPIIDKGKFKGYIGIAGLVLCLVRQ